jgi:hypothetical protein
MSDSILKIKKGKYELNRSVSVVLEEPMQFDFGCNYLLVGDNGIGKSSFVSKLLLPEIIPIAENNFMIFYVPQDVTIQYYLVKYYYNGLLNEQHDLSTIADALNLVKSKTLEFEGFPTNKIVFILDEVDQYLSLADYLKDLDSRSYSLFLITHNEKNLPTYMPFKHINFHRVNASETLMSME